jgi:indole-3-glycerol phosphate synthase
MSTYLDRILAAHRAAAAADRRPLDELIEAAGSRPAVRGFGAALASASARLASRGRGVAEVDGEASRGRGVAELGRMAIIAEIKRRSPSKGDLAPDLVPEVLAKAYAEGGATCLSVLTDGVFFGGSAQDLAEARAATELPVLRKDFTVVEADVCEARLMDADCVLLIAAALVGSSLARCLAVASAVGMDALVEVHDEAELARALEGGATLVGVNQRDLVSFEVDARRAERVVAAMPEDVVRVAESGISGPDDARRLADAGFDAVLVGESLVTAADPAAAVRALLRG